MSQTTPTTAPPIPLWERHQLFQEPAWPEGLALLEDEDSEGEESCTEFYGRKTLPVQTPRQ